MKKETLKRMLKSNLGFSLAEVVVAAGVMGLVGLVSMNSIKTINQETSQVKKQVVINNATNRVKTILSKVREADTPAGVQTCDDVLFAGPINAGTFFANQNLGEGVRLTNIAVNGLAGAGRRTVNVTLTFEYRHGGHDKTVNKVVQTFVASDAAGDRCRSYAGDEVNADSTSASCSLIYSNDNCADNLNTFNDDFRLVVSDFICSALGGSYTGHGTATERCDEVSVERWIVSEHLRLTGDNVAYGDDQVCLNADGGACRVLFDNNPCTNNELLVGMNVEGTAKICQKIIFNAVPAATPTMCQGFSDGACVYPTLHPSSPVVANTYLDGDATNDGRVNGTCSGVGSCTAICEPTGYTSFDSSTCSSSPPSSMCGTTPRSCINGGTFQSATPGSNGFVEWNCYSASNPPGFQYETCQACEDTTLASGPHTGFTVTGGVCGCPTGESGICSVQSCSPTGWIIDPSETCEPGCSNSHPDLFAAFSNANWLTGGATAAGSSLTINCDTGYSGTPTANCSLGLWNTSGSCSPSFSDCSNSSLSVANATLSTTSGTTSHGTNYGGTITCNSGYTGSPTVACDDGSWDPPVGSCTPVVTYEPKADDWRPGSAYPPCCEFSCDSSGNLLRGGTPSPSSRCSEGGRDYRNMTCATDPIDIPFATCSGGGICNVHNDLASCEGEYGSGNCKIIDGTVTQSTIYWKAGSFLGSSAMSPCTVPGPGTEGRCDENPRSCPSMLDGLSAPVACSSNGHIGNTQICGFEFDSGGPLNRTVRRYTCVEEVATPQQYTSSSCGTYSCTPDCSGGPGPDGCGGTCSFDCTSTSIGIPGAPLPNANSGEFEFRTQADPGCTDSFSRRFNYECDPVNSPSPHGWLLQGSCCVGGPSCI